jgi:YD repeat-containing protein
MPPTRQASFAGGELAPQLYGRTDLPRYGASLRTARNFICTAEGELLNRPGTHFVAETKDSTKRSRLIPFVYANDQSYVLEFGNLYFRVHYRSAYLAVEVVTTYLQADLAQLQYVQSGDTLTIVHPGYPVREVKRTAHTTWAIADKTFGPVQAAPTGGSRTLDATTTPKKPWEVWVTAVSAGGDESLPLKVVTQPTHADYCAEAGTTNTYGWTAASGAVLYRVFRGQSGVGGYIGAALGTSFRDDGQAPDYDDQFPSGTNPFSSSSNRPSAVTYFEQRLVFANTLNNPATAWTSRTGLFRNFDAQQPPADDDAVKFTLAARQYEEIRGLVPLRALLALTNSAEWQTSGAGPEEPLSATSIRARPQSYNGSALTPQPIVSGHLALYVQEGGARVRDLVFSAETDGYAGSDLSLFAHHLLEGRTIVDWAFQKAPHRLLWVVLDDGTLLGLTYDRDGQVVAWHRHDTDQPETNSFASFGQTGRVESVCVVPEGNEHALYLLIQRDWAGTAHRYVERMASRQVTDARLGVFLDSAVSFDGRNTSATTIGLQEHAGGGWNVNATIEVFASDPLFFLSDVGSYLVLNPNGNAELFAPFAEATVLRMEIVSYVSATEVLVAPRNADVPVAYRGTNTTGWGFAWTRFGGALGHLNGRYVRWVSDGNPSTGGENAWQVGGIVSGQLFIDTPGCVVTIGLPITSDAELLDVAADAKKGTAKLLTRLGLEMEAAATDQLFVGETLAGPLEPQPTARTLPDWTSPMVAAGDQAVRNVTVHVQGAWGRRGRAAIRHQDALPLGILSVWREIEFGDEE